MYPFWQGYVVFEEDQGFGQKPHLQPAGEEMLSHHTKEAYQFALLQGGKVAVSLKKHLCMRCSSSYKTHHQSYVADFFYKGLSSKGP